MVRQGMPKLFKSLSTLQSLALRKFWKYFGTHMTQGGDVGTQYRSAVFYHSAAQKLTAEQSKATAQADFEDPIVTEITAFTNYYPAEDYHQDYFSLNGDKNPYCSAVISPKVAKFRKKYANKLK